jgi:putative hydrolase of the HAD superfamily
VSPITPIVLPTEVRWLVFDAVGTLLTPEPGVAEAYARIGRAYGSRLTVDELGTRFGHAFRDSETRCFPSERIGRTSDAEERTRWAWIVATVLDDVTDQAGCFEALWGHFADPGHWRVYPDVAMTLERAARAGVRLAMASNFDGRLPPIVAAFPELRSIERVLVSSALGWRKPAPEFYATMLRELDADPASVVMIGDDPESDVAAPRRAGITAWWLNRDDMATTAAIPRLKTLTELDTIFAS